MNASKILTSTDGAYITDLLKNIAEKMKLKINTMDRDSWIKVFIETKDISGARNKKCFIRIFGVSLARSDPTTMFSHNIFNGNKLQPMKTSSVWAAAYTLYGPGWLKDTMDIGQYTAPTKLFKSCAKADVTSAKPFHVTEVYDDKPHLLHNLEITMKKICKVKGKGKTAIEPEIWADAMTKHFKDPTVKNVCLRLANTPVSLFKALNLLNGKELDKIAIATIWTGAHRILGQVASATKPTTIVTPPRAKSTQATQPMSEVKFSSKTKAAKKLGNCLLISKTKPKLVKTNTKPSKRMYNGYYKAKLPATINPFGPKALEEVTTHFSNLTKAIWSINKKAEVLPWYDNNYVKPLLKGSDELKTKEQLTKYTPNVYIEQGKNTWLRFHIAHNATKDKFVDTEAFSNMMLQVSYDKSTGQENIYLGLDAWRYPQNCQSEQHERSMQKPPAAQRLPNQSTQPSHSIVLQQTGHACAFASQSHPHLPRR